MKLEERKKYPQTSAQDRSSVERAFPLREADSLCQRVAIMHLGKIMAMDTPSELKAGVGGPETTLEDVFMYYTGNTLETGGTYRDTARTRRAARRLG